MKKNIPWIVTGIFILSTAILLFLTLRINQQNRDLKSNLGEFTNSTIATQVALLENDEAQITTYQATQTALQSRVGFLESELTAAQTNSNVMATEVASTKSYYACPNSAAFHPDYASNLAMSNALKAFVKDQIGGVIQDSNWSSIWSSSNSSYHNVFVYKDMTRIKQPYIVFLKEGGLSIKEGVFDINGQCWLDHW
jgi:hypothetical protein